MIYWLQDCKTSSSCQELLPDCKLSGRVLTPCDQICPKQATYLPLTAWHLEEKDFLILMFFISFLPFCTSGKTESLWICFLEWLQPPQSRLWFLCEALLTLGFVMSFLFHTQVSYVQLVSIGQLVSNVQLVPNIHVLLQLQPGSPQTSLSLDFLVPSHSEHPENILAVMDCLR